MDIPKEKLSLMGISIKVNRKELFRKTKAAKYTQAHLLKDVCSYNTIANIEHGKPSRFPRIYIQLAEKLGMKVSYSQKVDEVMDKLAEKLYIAVEYHDIEKIKYHCNRALDLLNDYKNTLWYGDLYKVINLIKEYHLSGTLLTSDYFEHYIDLIEEFPHYISEIMKSIIVSSACEDTSSQKYYEIYDRLEIEMSISTFNQINQLMYLFSLNKTSRFQKGVKLLEEKCYIDQNYQRLLDTYNLAITYFSYFDQDEIDIYARKIDDLIKEKNKIVSTKLYDIYFGLGIAYHKLGRYETSIKYMWQSYELDINKIKRTFLFVASAQRNLGFPIKLPKYSDRELKRFPLDDKMMYKYYLMEENDVPVTFRQKFIMENVLPNLHGTDEFSISIMRDELNKLVQVTSQYKDLLIFDIKTREIKEVHA